MMRIWKLIPTNPEDPVWNKWSPEPIIVRAESERQARQLAVATTLKTFPSVSGIPIILNPWAGHKKRRSCAAANDVRGYDRSD
jgi:hypothetical protein